MSNQVAYVRISGLAQMEGERTKSLLNLALFEVASFDEIFGMRGEPLAVDDGFAEVDEPAAHVVVLEQLLDVQLPQTRHNLQRATRADLRVRACAKQRKNETSRRMKNDSGLRSVRARTSVMFSWSQPMLCAHERALLKFSWASCTCVVGALLCRMARPNLSHDPSCSRCNPTLTAPADSPNRVTLPGSPPNFCRIQRNMHANLH